MMMIRGLREVIYIDETTFNLWMTPRRLWLSKRHNDFSIQTNRGSSLTLIAALGRNGLVHFELIWGGNYTTVYYEFIKRLCAKRQTPTVLVMDNLPIHKTKIVKKFVEST